MNNVAIENDLRMMADHLKAAREKARLSQQELSVKSGVSQNMITYIETGKRSPTIKTLLKLCEGIGIAPYALFMPNFEEYESRKEQAIDLISKL